MKRTDDVQYDIFISYRRSNGWDTAKHLRDILVAKGYRVFFDVDSLRNGDFNTALLRHIDRCKDFIIVLSENALDRCVNPGDWVRTELTYAIKSGKNIIPIMSEKFRFPENLPEDIDGIRMKNAVNTSYDYFDSMMEKLISFLVSKPHKRFPILPVVGGVALVAVVAALFLIRPAGIFGRNPSEPPAAPETATATYADTAEAQAATEPPTSAELSNKGDWTDNFLMTETFSEATWYDSANWTVLGSDVKRGEITSVTFLDTLADAPEDAWDVSRYSDGKVKAWTAPEGEGRRLYIAAEGGVRAPTDCSGFFCGYENVQSFVFNDCFHTDGVTNMQFMFNGCGMHGLDLSAFDTSDVMSMKSMFGYCKNLSALNIASIDTRKVEDMERMFIECDQLNALDLSSVDTRAVTTVNWIFFNCRSLSEIDISSWDLRACTQMKAAFYGCRGLSTLRLGRLGRPEDIEDIFAGVDSLKSIACACDESEWTDSGIAAAVPDGVEVQFTTAARTADGVDYQEAALAGLKAGDIVAFGSYEQDGDRDNGAEPIEWLVLEIDDGKATMITRYGLEGKEPYHMEKTEINWEKSTMRKWLNNGFLTTAFSPEEQSALQTVETIGDHTQDRVFLLSKNEASHYFASDSDRVCLATEAAKANGVSTGDDGSCWWWLRSPGSEDNRAVIVDGDGSIFSIGLSVDIAGEVARPVIVLPCS